MIFSATPKNLWKFQKMSESYKILSEKSYNNAVSSGKLPMQLRRDFVFGLSKLPDNCVNALFSQFYKTDWCHVVPFFPTFNIKEHNHDKLRFQQFQFLWFPIVLIGQLTFPLNISAEALRSLGTKENSSAALFRSLLPIRT